LPEKNIVEVGGRPMLAWTVEAALESDVFAEVFVSSEDADIRALAAELGAVAYQRPDELATDLVSATEVCIELFKAQVRGGRSYDAVVCLQPSSPLRTAADVGRAWEEFERRDADFLVSVTPIDPHYFHWAVRSENEWWRMWFGDEFLRERPFLPPVYRPNGAIKIARVRPLLERRDFFGPRLAAYEMPDERSLHVAEPFDLELARLRLDRR
jgi:CMP-N,N'-diacetyllegionaminic acid synthase